LTFYSLKFGEQNRLDTWVVQTLNTECKREFYFMNNIPPPKYFGNKEMELIRRILIAVVEYIV